MTIFLAGIHGVGKSVLGAAAAARLSMRHVVASHVIQDNMSSLESEGRWTVDTAKAQYFVAAIVNQLQGQGHSILLDGHFVLRGPDEEMALVDEGVFLSLAVSGVILLEASADIVFARLLERGMASWTVSDVEALASAERDRANAICTRLSIPLVVLFMPTVEILVQKILELSRTK